MYKQTGDSGNIAKFSYAWECLKIVIAALLLFLGVHIIFWVIGIIDKIINNPESVPLLTTFVNLEANQQILDISFNNDKLVLKSNDLTKWLFLLFLFVILFNVIGRTIVAILNGIVRIFVSVNFNKSGLNNNIDEYICEHCKTPYNPSDFRQGATIVCEQCNKAIRPKY